MLCRIKFNTKSNIIDSLQSAFISLSALDMKLALENIFNSVEIPEKYRTINSSQDGKYFWDSSLISVESVNRTLRTLSVDFSFGSSFDEYELCSSLKDLSLYLGDISVLFWHEDDSFVTSGWYKYHKGVGELYGVQREKVGEASPINDPPLNLYFEQREGTLLAIMFLKNYIAEEISEAKDHIDEKTLKKLNLHVEDLMSRYDSCNYDSSYMESLRTNLAIDFAESKAPNLVVASNELEDVFYSAVVSVRKYIFRLNQVKRYGLMSESGEILSHVKCQ